jgi:aminoglycoside phosphotransferase (APT) family kinase protein
VVAKPKPAAEVSVDADLVRRLLAAQHPDLADRPLAEQGAGWDNAMFRLGDDLVVRLPRRAVSASLVEHEHRWLPALAPRLPLAVPAPVRLGRPALGYPWSWTVCPWLPGASALEADPADWTVAAAAIGRFVAALHAPADADAPPNPFRGGPLAERSPFFLERVERMGGRLDGPAVLAVWQRALAQPGWAGPPVWLHGDLHPANLLVTDGLLSGVIDFGDLTAGDPAYDLAVAWMWLPAAARPAFRALAGVGADDPATWERARGWALAIGVMLVADAADVPAMAALGARIVAAVLADPGGPA